MTTAETTTRPSENTITRRKMLQSVAAKSSIVLAGSFAALRTASGAEDAEHPAPELLDLVNAHRAAWKSFSDSVNAADRLHPDYAGTEAEAILEMRNDAELEALQLVLAFPVRKLADARAKAAHLVSDDFGLDPSDFNELLGSLLPGRQVCADAVAAMRTEVNQPASALVDPVLAALVRVRAAGRAVDRAARAYDAAEDAASMVIGKRPWSLIAWRNYSAIGGSELARARENFLRRGVDPMVVEAEYEDAKSRVRHAIRQGREWDRKSNTAHLRRARDVGLKEYRRCLWALARTAPTTPAGAGAMAAWLAQELRWYDEKYHAVAAKSIARGLRAMAKAGVA